MKSLTELSKEKQIENPPGIFRTTLTYNSDIMLCHFSFKKGAAIPFHNHPAAQAGYVIKGKVVFQRGKKKFTADTGTSYLFEAFEYHGADVIEDAEIVECFTPAREEYK